MKARFPTWIALLLALVAILLVFVFLRDHEAPATQKPAISSSNADEKIDSSKPGVTGTKSIQQAGRTSDVAEAVKAVYAGAKITPDGKTRLDVTALEKSFKGYVPPVDLSSSSEVPRMRAEYMASTLTAALDMDTSYQPKLAAILEAYYGADTRQRPSASPEERESQSRSGLCKQARAELATSLPVEVREQLQEVFGSPNFLFETMSVSAEIIELEKDGNTVVTNGDAVFGIFGNGAVFMNGNSTSLENKPPRQVR